MRARHMKVMHSFILLRQLFKLLNIQISYSCCDSKNLTLHSSIYIYNDHVLLMKRAVCMCEYVGFTLVYSHVQQKAVMGWWVQGQTTGPIEVKTTCLQSAARDMNHTDRICLSGWSNQQLQLQSAWHKCEVLNFVSPIAIKQETDMMVIRYSFVNKHSFTCGYSTYDTVK